MKSIVDLFAGCGGMTKGFSNAGFEIRAGFELWPSAVACYKANFSHELYQTDLSQPDEAIEEIKSINPDIIIGGPPCQDFSQAGKRVESARASLTGSYAQIIESIRPQYFVMENVDRARLSNTYSYVREVFKNCGYGLTEIVLDASLCGVPQKRKRFFCIGSMGEEDGFLTDYMTNAQSEKEMTLRDYFGDSLGFEHYYRHPRNYSRRGVFSIDEPAPTMRGVNRPVPKGYPGHHLDTAPLTEDIRALTTAERAWIQTFPQDFVFVGNKTDIEQMIGNAVPVKLAEFVARALLYHISQKENNDEK